MTPQVHSTILHEIVRVINARAVVPERVRLRGREYQLAYLEDHRQRLEEAIRRRDADRLNMLYGQLSSKVKYQLFYPEAGKNHRANKRPNKTGRAGWTARSIKAAGATSRTKTGKTNVAAKRLKVRGTSRARA